MTRLPRKGRGEVSKMAEFLSIPQPQMSQILAGNRNLNLEQADLLSDYLDFTKEERNYLYTMVQIERAGRQSLKDHFIEQRNNLRESALQIGKVVSAERNLSDSDKSVFYSSWIYQAVRLLTSIENREFGSVEKISEHLRFDRKKIDEVMSFLLAKGLCIQEKNHITLGSRSTHLDISSPHLPRHHTNWRNKAIQKYDQLDVSDLIYTAPMTLSHKDYSLLREEILNLIKKVHSTVGDSKSEKLACLNIDFFSLSGKSDSQSRLSSK